MSAGVWRQGDSVAIVPVTVAYSPRDERVSLSGGRTVPDGVTTIDLELWDKAPLTATVSGYCDPWWARADGHWYIVCRPRSGKPGPVIAYDVSDEVYLRVGALRASPEVANESCTGLLVRRGYRLPTLPTWNVPAHERSTYQSGVRALLGTPIAS